MTPAIRASGVVVDYGRVRALDGVDLEIAHGQVTGLVGMNGSGKSTLFKALMGTVRLEAGEVRLDGLDPAPRGSRAWWGTCRRAKTWTGRSHCPCGTWS